MRPVDAPLYNARILRLATAIPHLGTLEEPEARVQKVSPICGSRVTAMLDLDAEGRVARFAQEVRACALGQAAAAILGEGVLGADAPTLRAAHAALEGYLKRAEPLPEAVLARFPELTLFEPARPHLARHGSICLAFDAAATAAEQARQARQAA
ncbi:iron-sulfur cluster assembly scaffold protein [Thermaurantiacus tibetensis]|uniref:iron-sulfur cluster assembly scaffold protein n=1 Tax=Thermaurantiacus tibetensis TaxID=2759035 RepID=UPI00188F5037|nr:iron-sulfur cluster assembly scaffold protein [Thermaurantiacus tibetensis]